MKIFNLFLIKQILIEIFLGILIGFLMGIAISYINLFGSSQNAPTICAIFAGLFSIMRIYKRQKSTIVK